MNKDQQREQLIDATLHKYGVCYLDMEMNPIFPERIRPMQPHENRKHEHPDQMNLFYVIEFDKDNKMDVVLTKLYKITY